MCMILCTSCCASLHLITRCGAVIVDAFVLQVRSFVFNYTREIQQINLITFTAEYFISGQGHILRLFVSGRTDAVGDSFFFFF